MSPIESNALEIAKEIDNFKEDLSPRILGLVYDFAEDVGDDAKQAAPVVSGRLRDGIIAKVEKVKKGEILAAFGWSKDAFYGMFVEFGTVKVAARPHIRPAFDRRARELQADINKLIDKLWARKT